MGPFDPLLERPGCQQSGAIRFRKARPIVGNAKLELVIRDCQPDFDPFRPAMTNRIGDRFTKELVEVELKPDRDGALIAVRDDAAIDRPLLAQALGKRAKFGDRVHKFKILVPTQGKQESADFPLFLHQQSLQLVKVAIHLGPRDRGALDGLDPKRGAGEELNDAVMNVTRQRQPSPGSGPRFDCQQQGLTLKDGGRGSPEFAAEIDEVGRHVGDAT